MDNPCASCNLIRKLGNVKITTYEREDKSGTSHLSQEMTVARIYRVIQNKHAKIKQDIGNAPLNNLR